MHTHALAGGRPRHFKHQIYSLNLFFLTDDSSISDLLN